MGAFQSKLLMSQPVEMNSHEKYIQLTEVN